MAISLKEFISLQIIHERGFPESLRSLSIADEA